MPSSVGTVLGNAGNDIDRRPASSADFLHIQDTSSA